MNILESALSSVKSGMIHVTDRFSHFLQGSRNEASTHTPVTTNITHHDPNNLNGASAAASGSTGTVPVIVLTPSAYDGSGAVLQQPASAYIFPYARHPPGSTQSLPPPYTPREDLPAYSRSLGGGQDDRSGLGFTATWRRISDRLSGTFFDNGPLPRPTQVWMVTSPRPTNRTNPMPNLPYPNAVYRPRRLDWLSGRWRIVTGLAIGGLVVGLVTVFILMEQKWEKSQRQR